MIVVFPGERAFGARLLGDTALLRRQSIDRLLRFSILWPKRGQRTAGRYRASCWAGATAGVVRATATPTAAATPSTNVTISLTPDFILRLLLACNSTVCG